MGNILSYGLGNFFWIKNFLPARPNIRSVKDISVAKDFKTAFCKVTLKKTSLVSGNRADEFFYYHLPTGIVERVSEYLFFVLKNTNTHTNKKQNKLKKGKNKRNLRRKGERKC